MTLGVDRLAQGRRALSEQISRVHAEKAIRVVLVLRPP